MTAADPFPVPARGRPQSGFSLIEMVIVIILLGIISAIGALIIHGGFDAYFAERDINAADAQAQIAAARMTRELRVIRTPTAADLPVMTASAVSFVDMAGNTITYQYDAATQTLTRAENGGAAQTLADHVASAAFSYWQSDAQTPATSAANLDYVTIQMTITRGVSSLTYRTTVHPRDFP
ncbi:MAG: prepilin-type N-terminal cleavage/methylation domain-containing protein [Acidiferrobacteraceae bacterium]